MKRTPERCPKSLAKRSANLPRRRFALGWPAASSAAFSVLVWAASSVQVAQAGEWEGCQIGLQAVPTVLDRHAPGVAFGLSAGGPPRIVINPELMALASPAQQKFIYWHECGHVALQHVQSSAQSEQQADCFALRMLRATGQLSALELVQLTRDMQRLPGDWSHQPGPERVRQMLACQASAAR